MTRRERIILIAMGLAIAYGAYSFLFSSPSPNYAPVESAGAVADMVSQTQALVEEVRKSNLSTTEKYVFDRSQAAWTTDPFLGAELAPVREQGQAVAKDQMQIVYTGFVEVGTKKLAVINGLEYEVGDVLEHTPYQLQEISPVEVLLEHGAKKSRITVPFTGGIYR